MVKDIYWTILSRDKIVETSDCPFMGERLTQFWYIYTVEYIADVLEEFKTHKYVSEHVCIYGYDCGKNKKWCQLLTSYPQVGVNVWGRKRGREKRGGK